MFTDSKFISNGREMNFQSVGMNFQPVNMDFESVGMNFQSINMDFELVNTNFESRIRLL